MPKVALELFNQVSCVNRAVEAVSSLFLINFAERKKKLLYGQGPARAFLHGLAAWLKLFNDIQAVAYKTSGIAEAGFPSQSVLMRRSHL